jgi:hypothetical protein
MDQNITIPSKNYNGIQFAAALELAMNDAAFYMPPPQFKVSFDMNTNMLTITQLDRFDVISFSIISDEDVVSGRYWDARVSKNHTNSMNGILRIGTTTTLTLLSPSYVAYIDLHGTRNLYMTSSSLASYNTMSNFANDVIIKKIPVKANYGQMIFDGSSNGYDYLQLSKRSLRRLDFRLEDSFGNIMNLNGNHWSFSLVFQIQ